MVAFLLRSMSPNLRAALEDEAQRTGASIQEVIRSVLCSHYELECNSSSPRSVIRADAWGEATTILLSLPSEVFEALKSESELSGETMRVCVLGALEGHFVEAA